MDNMQTFQNNKLNYSLNRAFYTRGAVNPGDIYADHFKPQTNSRYFKTTGAEQSKYIPIDWLPMAESNLNSCVRSYSTVMKSKEPYVNKYMPVINALLADKGITVLNANWWSRILTNIGNNKLRGWTEDELHDVALTTYEETPIKYSNGVINRENYMIHLNTPIGSSRMRDDTPLVEYLPYLRGQRLINATSGYSFSAYMSTNLVVNAGHTGDPLNSPLAYCYALKGEHFQDWWKAYESQVYIPVTRDEESWDDDFAQRSNGYSSSPLKLVTFDPKWFTVIWNEPAWDMLIGRASNTKHLQEYKNKIIDGVLRSDVDMDHSVISLNSLTSPIKTDIKSYLTTGLSNYAEESREFLSTLSRVKPR